MWEHHHYTQDRKKNHSTLKPCWVTTTEKLRRGNHAAEESVLKNPPTKMGRQSRVRTSEGNICPHPRGFGATLDQHWSIRRAFRKRISTKSV